MSRRRAGLAAALVLALAGGVGAVEMALEDLPPGPGREETFYSCTPCHAYRLVAAQSQSRERWDDTLDWMATRHGMTPLEGADRALVLDYLTAQHGPKQAPTRGFRNPFVN